MCRRTALILALLVALAALGSAPPAWAEAPAQALLLEPQQLVAGVWALADERLSLMPAVAAAKWQVHAPISDPDREASVIRAASDRAQAAGLARGPVESFFAVQIAAAREVQERLTAHWQQAGFDYQGPTLRLAQDLRPQLDGLTARLIDALYLAAPWLSEMPAAPSAGSVMTPAQRSAFQDALRQVRLAGPGSVQRARDSGLLRIGTPADYAPFALARGATVRGSDVELAAGLAAALGMRAVFIHTSWKTLLDELTEDHFDLVVGGVSATAARLARAEASPALSRSGKSAIGRCRDRSRFTSLAAIDQSAVSVIENPGGTNESFARAHLRHASLRIHGDNLTVFDELLDDHADVMFTDETEIRLAVRRHPELCRLLDEAYDSTDKVFLLAPAGNWPGAVRPWLEGMIGAGTPARLLDFYSREELD